MAVLSPRPSLPQFPVAAKGAMGGAGVAPRAGVAAAVGAQEVCGRRNSALPGLIRTFALRANQRRGAAPSPASPSARPSRPRFLGLGPVPRRLPASHELHAVQQGAVVRALGRGQEPGEWAPGPRGPPSACSDPCSSPATSGGSPAGWGEGSPAFP